MGQVMRPRRLLAATALAAWLAVLAGCAAPGPRPLYLWESFPKQQYASLLREGASPEEQIQALEAHAEKARAGNAALPPGLRAHMGMLYLGAGNPQRAKELWHSEKAAFPESAAYMDRLLNKLDVAAKPGKPAKLDSTDKTPDKKENPA